MDEQSSAAATKKSGLPKLPASTIWMINFGFLGVQIAFTLQSSQMSRIFQTIGADPNKLGWFFILPPLAGLIVQPIIGYYSDRTWAPKLGGRRLPYLALGTLIAIIVMCLLPNSGSFGFGYASVTALVFGAVTVALLDVSSNIAMQPFKMMVGDMVNDDQKSYAYGIQSFLSNGGAVIAAIFPFIFTAFGVANTAEKGVVPQSVVISFYVGAAILLLTSLLTIFKVHEYDPKTMPNIMELPKKLIRLVVTGGHCLRKRLKYFGQLPWFNSSAGLLSNISGLILPEPLPITYGTQPMQLLQVIKLPVTGTVF